MEKLTDQEITDGLERCAAAEGGNCASNCASCGHPSDNHPFRELKAAVERLKLYSLDEYARGVVDGSEINVHILDDSTATLEEQRLEITALRAKVADLRGLVSHQGRLLSELPPSADELIMAEMAAAVARTETRVAEGNLKQAYWDGYWDGWSP